MAFLPLPEAYPADRLIISPNPDRTLHPDRTSHFKTEELIALACKSSLDFDAIANYSWLK